MTKSRNHKEVEDYLGIIRQQKAEIKRLKRRIRALERESLLIENETDEEIVEFQESGKRCAKCNRVGTTETISVLNRMFDRCNNCGQRTKAKIL